MAASTHARPGDDFCIGGGNHSLHVALGLFGVEVVMAPVIALKDPDQGGEDRKNSEPNQNRAGLG